jgi:hypothetical protein
MSGDPDREQRADLVERNPDGSLTSDTLKRAMKAFRRRLKLTRADDESRLGRNPLTKGSRSTIVGIKPPEQYPAEVWDELVARGRLRKLGPGQYEALEP